MAKVTTSSFVELMPCRWKVQLPGCTVLNTSFGTMVSVTCPEALAVRVRPPFGYQKRPAGSTNQLTTCSPARRPVPVKVKLVVLLPAVGLAVSGPCAGGGGAGVFVAGGGGGGVFVAAGGGGGGGGGGGWPPGVAVAGAGPGGTTKVGGGGTGVPCGGNPPLIGAGPPVLP